MRRGRVIVISAFFLIPLFIAGCTDGKRLDEIEKTQKQILEKIAAIEENQQKILKFFPQRRPSVDYNKVYNIPAGTSPVRGNKDAPITITEFSDYQCPHCVRLQPILKEVLKAYPKEVRLVFKNFPLPFHREAKNAAKAAHAAGEQGKFWEMHDAIFKNYNMLGEEKFKELAGQIGLDVNKFLADYKSNKYEQQIQQDIGLGKSVSVRGTPTLFINGKRIKNRSFNDLKETIDKILKKEG